MKKTTFNLIISELTLEDSGEFQFCSSANGTQRTTIIFTLRVYEAITNVKVRKINSTWSSDTCTVWLQCSASHSQRGNSRTYTWTIRNETHTGATLKYVLKEVEEIVICTISNPASNESAVMRVGCSNTTGPGGGGSPTSGKIIEKKVGDTVEIPTGSSYNKFTHGYWKHRDSGKIVEKERENVYVKETRFKGRVKIKIKTFDLIISELTLQDSGEFDFFWVANGNQRKTISYTLRVYEAITNVEVREINSTWSSDTCTVWLQCSASPSQRGNSRTYTWTIRNETHMGATLKYVPKEVEEIVICTISNPASNTSAELQVGCSNTTGPGVPLWVFVLTGLCAGLLFLFLVLVFICRLKRRKAAVEAMETYATIDIPMTDNTSTDDETLGSVYATVKDGCVRPSPQKSDHAIYYTVQPIKEPSS